MYKIICAAGYGSRLYSESIDFPKPLLEYENKPVIGHLIETYASMFGKDHFIIVLGYKGQLIESWLRSFYPDYKFEFIHTEPNGTGMAVKAALGLIPDYTDILVSWADFIIDFLDFKFEWYQLEDEYCFSFPSVFFYSNIQCRYSVGSNNQILKEPSDTCGLFGLYYFNNKPQLKEPKIGDDLLDILPDDCNPDFAPLKARSLGLLTDILENKQSKQRYFNNLEFTETSVIKSANTPKYQDLILIEKEWIDFFKDNKHIRKYKSFKENKLELELIKGKDLAHKSNKNELALNIQKIKNILTSIHGIDKQETNIESTIEVYITKPYKRLKESKLILDSWFNGNYVINGIDFNVENKTNTKDNQGANTENSYEASTRLFLPLSEDLIPEYFTPIHGDIQFSNIIKEENSGDLFIIDPRGYFGNTKIYGDPAYDIAKVLYALDGYDSFNEGKFNIHKLSTGETVLIEEHERNEEVIKEFRDWAKSQYKISDYKLDFLLFSIWMSLTSYCLNSPKKVIGAYCKAMLSTKR